jgi:EAL domain-containing protein (putative c-di-GMP-specific phosphodiesterase class I)
MPTKQSWRNHYQLFNTVENQELMTKHHHLSEIEQALINNELTLYYQPKVNMLTEEVFGAEALIRWIHPTKGLIPPVEFLPTIDGTELEIKIGDWVANAHIAQRIRHLLIVVQIHLRLAETRYPQL